MLSYRESIRKGPLAKLRLIELKQAYILEPELKDIPSSTVVASIFSSIARSNTLILSSKLTTKQYSSLIDSIVPMRKLFQEIIEVGAIASAYNPKSRRAILTVVDVYTSNRTVS